MNLLRRFPFSLPTTRFRNAGRARPRRSSRAILCIVALLLFVADAVFLLPVLRELETLEESIRGQEELAGRYARRIEQAEAGIKALGNSDQAMEKLALLTQYTPGNGSVEEIATRFDAGITRLAPGNLRKIRFRPLQDGQEGEISLATFEYELAGNIQGLAALLDAFVAFDAPLLVREMCVTATPNRNTPLGIRMQLGLVSGAGPIDQP